jgi:hypothetical protein
MKLLNVNDILAYSVSTPSANRGTVTEVNTSAARLQIASFALVRDALY